MTINYNKYINENLFINDNEILNLKSEIKKHFNCDLKFYNNVCSIYFDNRRIMYFKMYNRDENKYSKEFYFFNLYLYKFYPYRKTYKIGGNIETLSILRNRIIFILKNIQSLNLKDFLFEHFLGVNEIYFSFEFVKYLFINDIIFDKNNLNKEIFNIINIFLKYDYNILPYLNNIKKYLDKEKLEKIEVLYNAKNFDLI